MCLGWGGVLKSRHLQVVALEHEGVTVRLNRAGWSEFWARSGKCHSWPHHLLLTVRAQDKV